MRDGPVKMNGGDEWEITQVNADTVVIAYPGAAAPVFQVGTYLANRTPAKLSDVLR